jgi:hypothetical protein
VQEWHGARRTSPGMKAVTSLTTEMVFSVDLCRVLIKEGSDKIRSRQLRVSHKLEK